jgi:galactokinase
VADSPYATARTAAFMGKKMLERALSKPLSYLTELLPSQLGKFGDDVLPPIITGEEFLTRYAAVDDPLSAVHAARTYALRASASFPVEENFRCRLAAQLLQLCADANRAEAKLEEGLRSVGELMLQSHRGYSSIGLGCDQTDVMVEAVQELGPSHGFYGARVSGGGSGGTVVVLLKQTSLPQLQTLATGMSGTSTALWPLIQ